jgi:hypothetical protein
MEAYMRTKLKPVDIRTIRPWATLKLESNMVAVYRDDVLLGYVWKEERRFPVLAGMIKVGETAKRGYSVSLANSSRTLDHFRTRKAAVELLKLKTETV